MKSAVWQLPSILLISVLFGLCANYLRPEGIPLVQNRNDAILSGSLGEEVRGVSLEEAVRMHENDQAVFMDARPGSEFEERHIQGAVSLPWDRAEELFIDVLPDIDPETTIITYCDGISCDLSIHLADFLADMGYTDVYVLPDGWSRWKDAGMPTAEGK